jgi:uncharacterized protein (DUF1800 family)
MAFPLDRQFGHLLRRAGFGARPDELERFRKMSFPAAIDALLNYQRIADEVDTRIGSPGYVGTTNAGGAFRPSTNITAARQRWLFRMVHTDRPLQEKMTLFWHNHFATAYGKLNGMLPDGEAARYLAAKPSEDPAGVRGQMEMLRDHALGNFEEILVNIAKDTAMLFWLDGQLNTRTRPQENFGREIMELFTSGVGNYTESDVYAAARVFTGWNLRRPGAAADGTQHYEFVFNANQHETSEKTFSFPVYPNGSKTIPARAASQGMQDGLDFIAGLAARPETGAYLATKLYRFFVSEAGAVSKSFVQNIAQVYLQSRYDMKTVMRAVLTSPEFWDDQAYYARFSWPVEFVVRTLKEVGWTGFSVNDALGPLANMGQTLFDPPDVAGWDLGQSWFSTGAMLSRMNFAATLAANQRFKLAPNLKPADPRPSFAGSPEALLSHIVGERLSPAPLERGVKEELLGYLRATGSWPASDAQLQAKMPGLVHLVAGSPEYQLV